MLKQFETALEVMRSAWRFRRVGLATAWLACVLGWLGVLLIPPQYEAHAKVYVDTNSLLRPLLQGIAVPPNTINQVDMVRRVLLGNEHLEEVVRETGLKARAKSQEDIDDLVDDLRRLIQLKGEGNGNERVPVYYSMTYRDRDPEIARAVVQALLDSFVQQSIGANRASSRTAERFLADQLVDYEKRLSDSERVLAEFKRQNLGAMPDERGGYFSRLQTEMGELDRLKSQLGVAQARREELSSKLVGSAVEGQSGVRESTVLETSVDPALASARQKLAELLLTYTERHPDVITLQETIARLERQRDDEIAALRSNRGAIGSVRGSTSLVAQNLQIALNQVEAEIAGLRRQIVDHTQRVEELRRAINTVPEVEAELARLTRDYNVTKTQYDALLQRLESARLSDQADRTDALKIRILEAPIRPREPVSPKLLVLLLGVLAGGIGAGAGVAFLLSKINPVFSQATQLGSTLKLPVIGFVDLIVTDQQRREQRRQLLAYSTAISLLLVAFVAVVVISPQAQALATTLRRSLGAV